MSLKSVLETEALPRIKKILNSEEQGDDEKEPNDTDLTDEDDDDDFSGSDLYEEDSY